MLPLRMREAKIIRFFLSALSDCFPKLDISHHASAPVEDLRREKAAALLLLESSV